MGLANHRFHIWPSRKIHPPSRHRAHPHRPRC